MNESINVRIASRVSEREARDHFESGASVLVSEQGHLEELLVGPSTVTHDKSRTTWQALKAQVDMWRNRYPGQRYYIIPA